MGENVRWRQTKILLRKNFILIKRSYKSTIIQILVPFLFVFFLWILQFGIKANEKMEDAVKIVDNPSPHSIGSIPRCIIGPDLDYCYTVAYVTNTTIGTQVINNIKTKNNIPDSEIREFLSVNELDIFLNSNPNSTTASVIFSYNSTVDELHYTFMYNQTTIYVDTNEVYFSTYLELPWITAIEIELARNITNNPSLNYKVNFIEYAHPELVIRDVIGDMGPVFFFAALMFNVVIQLGNIVLEKELKLREGMNMMGLKDSVYWFTWAVTNIFTNVVSSCILTASGYIFQFDFFKKNAFGTFFFLFILFGISMVTFVFFLSTIIKRADIATSIGFVIFLAGIVIQGFADFAFQESFYPAVRIILSFLPFALLSKGITDLSSASAGSTAPGLKWSERFDNAWFPLSTVYSWLIFDFFFFFVLALYLDNVVPGLYGTSKSPIYFLKPSYWFPARARKNHLNKINNESTKKLKDGVEMEGGEQEDEDVALERIKAVDSNLAPHEAAVRIVNLRKEYKKSKCCGKSKKFVAVKNTCLTIPEGQLFVLLGHNGAGKSTTFNMLTGLFAPTSGDAFIFGNSILTNMEDIRRTMGVCNQADLLYENLTGREHLEMFASFKGVPEELIAKEVKERLNDVQLTNVADLPTSKYSGGMRRRLSTSIALIADPKIVYLDECTTGMDVIARRQVWDLIEKVKRGRVIILTTHSMEEAEILGDRIGIYKKGKLKCLGTPLRLKNKFGAGYNMVVLTEPDISQQSINDILKFFEMHINIQPTSQSIGAIEFQIGRDKLSDLVSFFEKLESAKSVLPIKDIQISMTNLEEVFKTIAGHEEE